MTGFKIDYEVIDPSVTEQKIIDARFSHLFDVDVLGRFWAQLIDQIEDSAHAEVKTRMKNWLKVMIANRTLIEPFDTVPVPIPKGALPILARYNYTPADIQNAIAVKLGVPLNETIRISPTKAAPQATSTAMKQKQRLGTVPVVTEETTITQSHTYETPEGTVTEIRVVEVDKPPVSSVIRAPKKPDPFAPSSNWTMDEPQSPPPVATSARHVRGQRQPQETPSNAPPEQSTMAPRKKIDPFAPSTNWMMDEQPSPPPTVTQPRQTQQQPQTPTRVPPQQPPMAPRKKIDPFAPSVDWFGEESPTKAESPKKQPQPVQQQIRKPAPAQQQAPVQKRNDFASSLAFGDPESPKNSAASRHVKPTQQMATVQQMQTMQAKSPPRPKRNDFATSIAFGSPEKPSFPKISDKTTIKQTHTVETSHGTVSESKTVINTKTQTGSNIDSQVGFNTQRGSAYRSNIALGGYDDISDVQQRIRDTIIEEPIDSHYQSRRGDAYKSSIGFGSEQDSPPRRGQRRGQQEPAAQAPPVHEQGAEQIYRSRKGDAYKSSISFF